MQQNDLNNLSDAERSQLAYERTRLASERTFLSWIRTGLTGIGLGIAIAKLLLFENPEHRFVAKKVGDLLILWGILVFAFAYISIIQSYKKLGVTNGYKANLFLTTVLIASLISISFLMLWITS